MGLRISLKLETCDMPEYHNFFTDSKMLIGDTSARISPQRFDRHLAACHTGARLCRQPGLKICISRYSALRFCLLLFDHFNFSGGHFPQSDHNIFILGRTHQIIRSFPNLFDALGDHFYQQKSIANFF